ncbi:MAG: hypothetical protein R2752_03270 [Vicinamibacterales bacterium]
MRIRTCAVLLFVSAFFVAGARPALAQSAGSTEVGVSYSFLQMYDYKAPGGVAVDFARTLRPMGGGSLGVVGELGVNHFSDDLLVDGENQLSLMGGVRLAAPKRGQIRPFGQVLMGLLSSFDEHDFAIQPGGGVNMTLRPNTDLRVQVDFPFDFAASKTFTGFRFNVGVAFWLK